MSGTSSGESASPLVSSLRSIFSAAQLQVSLAGLTQEERNRDVAFYDEVLFVAVRLGIPASDKTLPFPAADSQRSYALPIAAAYDDDDDDADADDDQDSAIERPPKLLLLLMSALQVKLEADYTAPRLSNQKASSAPSGESPSSNGYLIPSISEKDAAYQSITLPRNSGSGEVTQMSSVAWSGNKVPGEVAIKGAKDRDGDQSEISEEPAKGGGEVWYLEEKGEGKWMVEWRCRLPIMFMRTRHPTPAMMLTATMTLRLQPSNLSRLAPSLVPASSASASASESLFLHDLLNPLSEGPSYPDESPAERAARSNASLAKLPLGKLPSSVLGSKLVTPARNAKEVGQIIASKTTRNATENGDMGDAKDAGRLTASRGGRRILTNEGLMAFQLGVEGKVNKYSEDQANGLGEEVIVIQRSARKVLDVQSAILVRMRTITVPGMQGDKEDVAADALIPTLILCVEVENPVNSGMRFAMDRIDVVVVTAPPNSSTSSGASESRLSFDVSMHRIGDAAEPMVVEQGSQHNLLYQVEFICNSEGDDKNDDVMQALVESHRNVSIRVLGRPILLREEDEGTATSYMPTRKFQSTWTCTLDLSAQMRMVALQRVMHNGAGGSRFGGQASRSNQVQRTVSRPAPAPITTSNYLAELPASPYSSLPRTPTELRSASTFLTPTQASPSQMLSLRRPSLRSAEASSVQSEALVSLQRSESDRPDASYATSPAMSSALANQSILARARMNRSSTMASGRAEESRQLLDGRGGGQEARPRNASERTITPAQRHLRRPDEMGGGASNGAVDDSMGRNFLLPLGDRRSAQTVQRLLHDPASEQGLLIDVVAHVLSEEQNTSRDSQRSARVEVQVENRSERTKTLIFSWKPPPPPAPPSSSSSSHSPSSLQSVTSTWNAVLLEDDDVQVGPLSRGDAEVITLNVCFTKSGVQQLPPLAIYDTSNGMERILHEMQSIVV